MTQIVIDLIQFKRGTTAERLAVVPADAEPIKDQDTGEMYLGDGVTPGGNPVGGTGSGISLGTADARYVKLSDIGDLKGADGQIRFTGQGAPGTIIGANPLDTYLDTLTGNIYQLT